MITMRPHRSASYLPRKAHNLITPANSLLPHEVAQSQFPMIREWTPLGLLSAYHTPAPLDDILSSSIPE